MNDRTSTVYAPERGRTTRRTASGTSDASPRGAERGRSRKTQATGTREDRRAPKESTDRTRKQRSMTKRRPTKRSQQPKPLQSKVAATRLPLVVTGMSVLGVGLVATLWLSIATVSGSYELQQAEMDINALTEEKERLVGANSTLDSTPALQKRAEEEGLVPGPTPAYLVLDPDGKIRLVGEPEAAPKPVTPEPPVQAEAR